MSESSADPQLRTPMRFRAVLAWSSLVGFGGGLLGFCYLGALHGLEHLLGPDLHSAWIHLPLMIVAGLVLGRLVKWLGSPGDIELLVDNVHVLDGSKAELKQLRALVPISLLCISSGGGAGPEAPLVQTTGTCAQWFSERFKVAHIDRRLLTIAAMASAFTVLFGAPIGGALFALEILHRKGLQYHEALLPAVVASLIGYAVYVAASGLGLTPVWNFAPARDPLPIDILWAVGAGVLGAGIAIAFSFSVERAGGWMTKLPLDRRLLVGGVLLGLLGLLSPYALTYGKGQLDPLLMTAAPASFFVFAALAKFVGTTTTVACGWRGGFIIPLFFIGAALAHAIHLVLPVTNEAVIACALMAAINTGVTKTPLGSSLVVSKMVGLSLVPTTAVAAVLALLLTHRSGLMSSQRERAA